MGDYPRVRVSAAPPVGPAKRRKCFYRWVALPNSPRYLLQHFARTTLFRTLTKDSALARSAAATPGAIIRAHSTPVRSCPFDVDGNRVVQGAYELGEAATSLKQCAPLACEPARLCG